MNMIFRKLADDDYFGFTIEEIKQALAKSPKKKYFYVCPKCGWRGEPNKKYTECPNCKQDLELKWQYEYVGDEELLGKLFRTIDSYILGIAYHTFIQHTTKENLYEFLRDYIQDKLLNFYDPDKSSLKKWLMHIGQQGKKDYYRKFENVPYTMSVDEPVEGKEDEMDFGELIDDPKALDKLKEKDLDRLVENVSGRLMNIYVDKVTRMNSGLTTDQYRRRLTKTFEMMMTNYYSQTPATRKMIADELYGGSMKMLYRAIKKFIKPIMEQELKKIISAV